MSSIITQDSEMMDILAECYVSTKAIAKTFFPERFFAEFSPLHDQIFDLIDSGAPRIAIAAPRGIGKTSIVGLAKTAQSILFRQKKFIAYTSTSHDSALQQTENLKRELVSNPLVRKFFGKMKVSNDSEMSEAFSKKSWVAYDNTLILPRGSGQQIRGALFRNARPDLFIVDDLEDPETIENEEIRRKRKEWFNADLLKAVSRLDKNWQIIYIDTLKHEDALLQDLLDSSEWESVRLEICDDKYEPTAPGFMDKAEIMREVNYHREQGILDVFYREYRNLPISGEDAVFQAKYFKYYQPEDLNGLQLETFIIVDPAKTVKMQSADSAIVGISLHQKTGVLFIRDIVAGKMYPDELYNNIFEMAKSLRCHVVGIEVTSLHEFITQPIKNEMSKRGIFFELIELKARGGSAAGKGKAERVAALAPYYRQGYIVHNEEVCGGLESQLLGFPRSKRWDIMDATAYLVEMLEIGTRYFDPPEDDEDFDAEEIFNELDYEDPVEDWRIA